ncbi:TOBE domain-containing protein [Mesorhizobium sp. M4B.F.Ca.ET.049.02.1.2]|uniref:TOBE domain-containing protein n=1 Tax=Mesorhizobium sp. M4B.F.Ca.ET.049.02.1.2 TaxID=2496752 RepID=UPI001FE134AD|nr:TOBE domain-containing protein [Mesorhizobium sp. M4B.F.Ca.ET.049.02.1.2]
MFSRRNIFLYGTLIVVAVYYLLPLYVMVVTSLKGMPEIRLGNIFSPPLEITFEPWVKAWSQACTGLNCDGLSRGFWNSVRITVPSVILSIAIASVNGYALANWRFKGADTFFVILIVGAFIPYQVMIYPIVIILRESQRVAIGRALVRDVDVFLFDEPLSNLDAKLRSELRVEIKLLHRKLENTMIYVTHDQIEAMTLADRIAVMRGGVIQQLDAPQTIYNRPVNRFVAGFLGSPAMNFLKGELEAGTAPVFKADGVSVPLGRYQFDGDGGRGAKPCIFGIRPEHIAFGDAAAAMPFTAESTVEIVDPMGSDTLVWTKLGGQIISFRVEADKTLRNGDAIRIGFDPARASLFDAQTDNRL